MYLDIVGSREEDSRLCELKVKEHINLFAGVCLMLAAKSVELDERIPFLSTMKKYMKLALYIKEDIKKAERKVIDCLNFRMHLPNLFDLTNYYGSQGVIFTDDRLKTNRPTAAAASPP